ncbi:FKBP-type peptidyl-prolyl cis-trans isomerase [Carboxylicivirga taeanensis]|uniref:FKBP-type peptidyl-prolyl cis-trans isomerase n=1 Tax=Carboxylicivirga taeanensis TaxID=1416875 RepID=UPI003F6E22B6
MDSIKALLIFVCLISAAACKEAPDKKKRITSEMLLEMNKKMVAVEANVIEQYIADNDLEMQKSGTGYYYRLDKRGTGDTIRNQDVVTLAYTTRLLDGTVCYASATDGLMEFTVGRGHVEAGLEQFVQMLQPGATAKLILPPYLAHGVSGDGNKIPKLAIVIMDIEVLEVQRSRVSP